MKNKIGFLVVILLSGSVCAQTVHKYFFPGAQLSQEVCTQAFMDGSLPPDQAFAPEVLNRRIANTMTLFDASYSKNIPDAYNKPLTLRGPLRVVYGSCFDAARSLKDQPKDLHNFPSITLEVPIRVSKPSIAENYTAQLILFDASNKELGRYSPFTSIKGKNFKPSCKESVCVWVGNNTYFFDYHQAVSPDFEQKTKMASKVIIRVFRGLGIETYQIIPEQ